MDACSVIFALNANAVAPRVASRKVRYISPRGIKRRPPHFWVLPNGNSPGVTFVARGISGGCEKRAGNVPF
jgi:hypothetical protein